MTEHYYVDTNILVKYSCYQNYKNQPEDGVQTVRELINNRKGIFYLSHLTLWEFYQVLLKYYRANPEKIFGNTSKDCSKNFMRIISEVQENLQNGYFQLNNLAITTEVFIKTEKLMLEYGFKQKRALDSIDALHIALVQSLIRKHETNITIICADETMSEICEREGMTVLFIAKSHL